MKQALFIIPRNFQKFLEMTEATLDAVSRALDVSNQFSQDSYGCLAISTFGAYQFLTSPSRNGGENAGELLLQVAQTENG